MNTKEKILLLLELNRGKYISGVQIAKELEISRNAVWKTIQELIKKGYQIQSVKNQGYCLCENNDILSVQGMLPYLANDDYAKQITVYDVLSSTNQTAKEWASRGATHGTTIIADAQTAGRGRYGRVFYSPSDSGIYMSIILHPEELRLHPPAMITAYAALVVCNVIETLTGKESGIKWINDIYMDGKKICGILTEAVMDVESGNMEWVVVGIGINFSTKTTVFPEPLQQTATSLFVSDHPNVTRNHVAAEIINGFLSPKISIEKKEVFQTYKRRLMVLNKKITVHSMSGDSYKAIARDMDADGHLLVEDAFGTIHVLSSEEVRIQPDSELST